MSCSPRIYVIMQATTMLIKFCDLPWGWPKCSVMSQVVSHLTRGTRFESRLGCSQTYAFWGDKVLSRLAVKDRQVLHV